MYLGREIPPWYLGSENETSSWSENGLKPPSGFAGKNMGVSENSVPLNPMVNDHYPH